MLYYDEELGEYVYQDTQYGLGEFFGATAAEAKQAYLEALRVWADHARKNQDEWDTRPTGPLAYRREMENMAWDEWQRERTAILAELRQF